MSDAQRTLVFLIVVLFLVLLGAVIAVMLHLAPEINCARWCGGAYTYTLNAEGSTCDCGDDAEYTDIECDPD